MTIIYKKSSKYKKTKNSSFKYKNIKFFPDKVSIITCTNRPYCIKEIFNNYSRQIYKNKELIIILNNNSMDIEKYKSMSKGLDNVKIYQVDEKLTLGECKNIALDKAKGKYIAFFDDDDYYGPYFLNQAIYTFNTIDCDIVGKSSCFVYFEGSKTLAVFHHNHKNLENKYVDHIMDSSMVVKRKVIEKVKFPKMTKVGTIIVFQEECIKKGFKIFSTDRYNYVFKRHPNPETQHVWKDKESYLLVFCEIIAKNIINFSPYVNP